MRAAEQVGAAARPLPLFYALSQAGRAVAAAHAEDPWELRGHGLQLKDEGQSLLERRVTQEGGPATSFRRVAEATGSDVLAHPVTFSALCASLPDLAVVPELCGGNPRALFVQPITRSGGAVLVMSPEVDAYVVNLPADVGTATDTAAVLGEHLRHYPSATGWALPDHPQLFPSTGGWGATAVLRWRTSGDVASPNEPDRQARMREVAPQYRHFDQQWCQPAVASPTLLSPLMTWWALLYALSMVARYEPAAWVGLLNIDKNPLAVPPEGLLETHLRRSHTSCSTLFKRPRFSCSPRLSTKADDAYRSWCPSSARRPCQLTIYREDRRSTGRAGDLVR